MLPWRRHLEWCKEVGCRYIEADICSTIAKKGDSLELGLRRSCFSSIEGKMPKWKVCLDAL